jgi:hypothetical protein
MSGSSRDPWAERRELLEFLLRVREGRDARGGQLAGPLGPPGLAYGPACALSMALGGTTARQGAP